MIMHTVSCPVCGANGEQLHEARCSLFYSCERCDHEWQIDPGEEPLEDFRGLSGICDQLQDAARFSAIPSPIPRKTTGQFERARRRP